MWMVNPEKLCRKHLLGEHVECHMFVGTILKGKKLHGYAKKGLVEVHNIKRRHEDLKNEMLRRGMKHNSELPFFEDFIFGIVDVKNNEIELKRRCKDCKF